MSGVEYLALVVQTQTHVHDRIPHARTSRGGLFYACAVPQCRCSHWMGWAPQRALTDAAAADAALNLLDHLVGDVAATTGRLCQQSAAELGRFTPRGFGDPRPPAVDGDVERACAALVAIADAF